MESDLPKGNLKHAGSTFPENSHNPKTIANLEPLKTIEILRHSSHLNEISKIENMIFKYTFNNTERKGMLQRQRLNYNPRNHISRGKEEYEHEYRGKNYSKLL
jgi:hypothetical protein